jgi:5-methylcytosine-specific restriction protein A
MVAPGNWPCGRDTHSPGRVGTAVLFLGNAMPAAAKVHRHGLQGATRHSAAPPIGTDDPDLYNDRRWKAASRAFRSEHPLCAECQRAGRTRAAHAVDHIVPHGGDLVKFWDRSNWQSLCQSCHSRKTNRQRPGTAPARVVRGTRGG